MNCGNHVTFVLDNHELCLHKISKVSGKQYEFTKEMPTIFRPFLIFLSNYENKRRFIKYFTHKLENQCTKCCRGEADELTDQLVIQNKYTLQQVIIAEDISIICTGTVDDTMK